MSPTFAAGIVPPPNLSTSSSRKTRPGLALDSSTSPPTYGPTRAAPRAERSPAATPAGRTGISPLLTLVLDPSTTVAPLTVTSIPSIDS